MRQGRMGSRGGRDDARGGGGGGLADMIARHETGRAIHAVMSRKIGMTAGAVVHLDAADGPLGHHAATGTTHAAAVGGPPDRSGDRSGDGSMRGGGAAGAEDWDRPRGAGALAILEPHAGHRRVEDSGATKTVAHVAVRHGWPGGMRDPRMARGGRGMPHRSQRRQLHSRRAWRSLRACLRWALRWHSASLCSRGPIRN